jgi:hypothetical protein
LLLQGVRMTTPGLEVTAGTVQDMPRVWPGALKAVWPGGAPVSDTRYEAFALGRDLQVREPSVSLRPWKPATELPASELTGDLVELPTACGKHFAYYLAVLVSEAMRGRFYAFVVSCDCGLAYLIHTEPDGAHCKAGGGPAGIAELYDGVPGDEETFTNGSISFRCKRLE